MNEEEVKVQIVIPWLHRHGIELSDLQLEHTFTIRVGRQTIRIGGPEFALRAARFDILVRRGEKNLFIVETKALDLPLTEDDRDQAISYARLVHPIAPFALLTNGREVELYHSITRKRIEPEQMAVLGFDVQLTSEALFETQSRFLRLSLANFALFCGAQVDSELRRVRGDIASGKKYVPSLHVARESLHRTFGSFRASAAPCLLLSGASGAGKTSELCCLAESLLQSGEPVFFFNGPALSANLCEAITAEFAWSFEGTNSPVQTFKRIEFVLSKGALAIIIDAVDEWSNPSALQQLDELVRAAENHRIKLILGCKSTAAPALLAMGDDLPSFIGLLATKVALPPLTEREFHAAIDRYRAAYHFQGAFERDVFKRARENPFLLRVFFDVARDSNARHLTFSSEEFFRRYYEKSLRMLGPKRQSEADETLVGLARLLWEENRDSVKERTLRLALGLKPSDLLQEELFEHDILIRTAGSSQERYVSFYFQQLRDYLVAFRGLHFNEMPPATLRELFDAVVLPSMRGEVFTLYYRLAPRAKQAIFDNELRANASRYLECYLSVLREHFPTARRLLVPPADDVIGFVGELLLSRGRIGMYGFRKLGAEEDPVHFVPVDSVMDDSNLAELDGARYGMHSGSRSNGFRNGIDIRAAVFDDEVLPRFRKLIHEARLDESETPDLLIELITETVLNERGIFRSLLETDGMQVRYPLNLSDVRACIQRERLKYHFEEEIIKRRRESGEIREHWAGSRVSYQYQRTPEDTAEVEARVEEAMRSGQMPKLIARRLPFENIAERLLPAMEALRARGTERIDGDGAGVVIRAGTNGFSIPIQALQHYVRELTRKSDANYRILVGRNFPTLTSGFASFSQPPLSHFFVLGAPAASLRDWRLTVYSGVAGDGSVVCKFTEDVLKTTDEQGAVYVVDGIDYAGVSITSTSVERYLAGDANFGDMHLRSWVYSTVAKEWASIERRSRADPGRHLPPADVRQS